MIHIWCMDCKTNNDYASASSAASGGWHIIAEIIEGSTRNCTQMLGQCRLCYASHMLRWHEEQMRARQMRKGLSEKQIKTDIDRMVGNGKKRRGRRRRR